MATLQLISTIKTNTATIPDAQLLTLAEAMHIPESDPVTGDAYTIAERQDLLFAEILQPVKNAVSNYKRRLAGPPDISDIIQE